MAYRMNQRQAPELWHSFGRLGIQRITALALVRLSARASRLGEQLCNGSPEWIRYKKPEIGDTETPSEKWEAKIIKSLETVEARAEALISLYPSLKLEHQRDPRGAPFNIRFRRGKHKGQSALIF